MFIVNISRISLEIIIFHKAGLKSAIVFHDYYATWYIFIMFAIFWLVIYQLMLKSEEEKVQV
jgi:exosortase/archaeosortase family protein